MLLFFFWIPGLFFGDGKIPSRTYALLGIATVLSIVWFAQGWQHGLNDNGVEYTLTLCGVNIAVVLVLAIGFFKSLKEEPSFTTSLILHWFLFAWLAWYAFPWLGEMI